MRQPLVYIILLNYNGYKDTVECVKSLQKIKYSNYKIVIVDNNSDDNSETKLKADFPEIFILQAGVNLGFAAGNNIGIKYAIENNAEYVLLLNNDTVVRDDFLECLIKGFTVDKKIGMVGGKIYYYDLPDKIWYNGGDFGKIRAKGKHYTNDSKLEYRKVNFITGCLQLISVEALKNVGLMEEKYFLYYEDVEYCFRFIKKGYKLMCSERACIYHKCGSSSSYKSPLSIYYSNRNRFLFINENFKGINLLIANFVFMIELFIKLIIYKGEKNIAIKKVFKYIFMD